MNLIYNSDQYSVVEFGADNALEALRSGGYEIMDKSGMREIFIAGTMATAFREHVEKLIASNPDAEQFDAFLAGYEEVMHNPVIMH